VGWEQGYQYHQPLQHAWGVIKQVADGGVVMTDWA
jgi:hypothetical protein